ncbi:MAG TPA: HEAT repeat domain-containing protein, partial [Bacteroidetes bacterium]|nr:HEAT repeat domain-containing protein [Bacteroidota bacterium]
MRDRLANDGYAAAAAFLHDQRPEVREEAAYVFARSEGGAAVTPALREAFDAGTGDPARVHLARAIAALNSDDDTDRLADALANDPDWRTRVAAATGLADRLRQPTARGALVRALDDGVHHVRVAAASALASDGPLPQEYLDRLETWVAARDTADWHAGAALLPALVRGGRLGPAQAWLDRHAAPFARASGLAAFAFATDDASLERLTTLATDTDSRIRNAALTALASRWRRGRSNALAARLFVPLRAAVESGDPAAVTLAAPVFADSLFVMYEAPSVLRAAYRQLEAPADLEAMVALLNAIGQVRDAGEIDFLLDIAIAGQEPALRRAAAPRLDRLRGRRSSRPRGRVDGPTTRALRRSLRPDPRAGRPRRPGRANRAGRRRPAAGDRAPRSRPGRRRSAQHPRPPELRRALQRPVRAAHGDGRGRSGRAPPA